MNRRKVLLGEAAKLDCSALIAFEPENVFYVTGFWGEAIAVVNEYDTKLIAPKLEVDRAMKDSKGCRVISSERGGSMIEALLANVEDERVCTDCNDIDTFDRIKRHIKVVYSTVPFYQSRMVKDHQEIRNITDSAKILDRLFVKCEQIIKAGITERQVQAELLYEAMSRGAYPPSYKYTLSPLIVASGINSSLPHAEPTDRKIRASDFVTVDLTLRYKGYIADATRTFVVGRVSSEMRKVYGIVREAQERGLDAVRSGIECGAVDDACRSHIEKAGYGKHFVHSTGHGIGLQIHEPPWLRMKSKEKLQGNMAVTVEPGVYIPNRFGVRIEDSLIVDKKARVLNKYPKEMIAL
ncbi:MAG: aminopeptidase P family protein [Nitrososphaerales archaeon]